jgi:hypothetical protein
LTCNDSFFPTVMICCPKPKKHYNRLSANRETVKTAALKAVL